MSAISRTTATAGADAPRKTYIAMRGYYYDFFTYTTNTTNFVTSGGLTTVAGASTGNCLRGAFLRETGRRIYPGANPGVTTMMVSVFDADNMLTGFIDPNSEAFTPQNADRAYYIDSAGINPNSSISWTSDQGPPVFTHGNVHADGTLYISSTASTIGNAYFASNLSTVGNVAVGGNENIRGSLAVKGEVKFFSPATVGFTRMNPAIDGFNGGFQRHAVTNTNYNSTTSHVFLTPSGIGNSSTKPMYSVEPISHDGTNVINYAPSTFYIVSLQVSNGGTNDTTSFSYLIVNEA